MTSTKLTNDVEDKEENEPPIKVKKSNSEEVAYRPVKLSRSDLYRPPTVEELNQLKEAESLFHCSLLKMQVRLQTQQCQCDVERPTLNHLFYHC